MKKQLLVLTAAFLITVSSAFATEKNPVPDAIAKAFSNDFRHTGNVQWKTTDAFYKASFTAQGQLIEAFYNHAGKMIGLSRFLSPEQLPLSLIKEVMEKKEKSAVKEIFELLTDKGTEYFITYTDGAAETTYTSDGDAWVRY